MAWRLQQGMSGGSGPPPSAPGAPTAAALAGSRGRAAALRADVLGARMRAGSAGAAIGGGCKASAQAASSSSAPAPSSAPPARSESAPDLAAHFFGTAAAAVAAQSPCPDASRRPASASAARPGWTTSASLAAARPCSAGTGGGGGRGAANNGYRPLQRSLAQPNEASLKTPVASYLRLFGLGQYAGGFADGGLKSLESLARLPEREAVEFVEELQLYPGHRARLLRAMGLLRQLAALGGREQAALQGGPPGEERMVESLCARLEMVHAEKDQAEAQSTLLQEENHRLLWDLEATRERMAQVDREACLQDLERARERIDELERLVWTQTEQVSFLAGQLQRLVGLPPPHAPHAAPTSAAA
eukprot:CAMPEP_0203905518 /NCGR_PEP_ID=MMETSP0359-20131031/47230_1 /ASSEMBLY_ACC=CAM_ASM_000338 /TAXON_ID=268821 /ORGANISM="Scrippsiella Hangoei, Strain SHTV-5" /LENGTH=359 /DNA_ID=CAMNT_0050829981 /DNA_START=59 /DNA_END=1134 /DNA_ORIENTATION=-